MEPATAAACFICDKQARGDDVPGGVLHLDDVVYAGHTQPLDEPDAALGYLMVEPRRHVARLGDLTDEEAARLGLVVNRLSRALRDVAGVEHVYAFVFGDRVPHLHVHLAPRYPGAPPALHGLGAVDIQRSPDVPRGDRAAIDQLCDRLRAAGAGT
ncbi:MAG: HIT family protein [Acidimicrobiia bacterium]